MQFRNLVLAAAVVLGSGIGGYALYQGPGISGSHTTSAPGTGAAPALPRTGVKTAADRVAGFNLLSDTPPIPLIEMHDEEGRPVTFDRFKGKVVLFNLWATWCPPCIREMPDINALQAQYRDRDFVVVPVASGRQGEEEPAAFLRKRSLNELTTYYDPRQQFLRIFDLETLPITFLIDRDGMMRGGAIGLMDWSTAEAKALVEALLDENKS
ncbi:MAG: TlpA disulfide reductase family protein [Sedimenticola sp.]